MAISTAAAVITAASLLAVPAVSMQRQAETARRAETRQRNLIAGAQQRQAKQDQILARREADQAKKVGARLRATAGRRAGRRSLISGSETGASQSQLGQQQQLG